MSKLQTLVVWGKRVRSYTAASFFSLLLVLIAWFGGFKLPLLIASIFFSITLTAVAACVSVVYTIMCLYLKHTKSSLV